MFVEDSSRWKISPKCSFIILVVSVSVVYSMNTFSKMEAQRSTPGGRATIQLYSLCFFSSVADYWRRYCILLGCCTVRPAACMSMPSFKMFQRCTLQSITAPAIIIFADVRDSVLSKIDPNTCNISNQWERTKMLMQVYRHPRLLPGAGMRHSLK